MRDLWPFTAFVRRRRIAHFSRLRALAYAGRALYASSNVYAPYRTVNAIQRAVDQILPAALHPFLPADLHVAAGKRASQNVLVSAQAQLVREASINWYSHHRRAVLPVPSGAWKVWPGGAATVDRLRSASTFALFLLICWLNAARRFVQLVRHMQSPSRLPTQPYVAAMNLSVDVMKCADRGGFLNWLSKDELVKLGAEKIVAVSPIQASGLEPAWLHVIDEVLPSLEKTSFGFIFNGVLLLSLMPFLALVGIWQSLALLPDLIELSYVRRVSDKKLARAYLFLLGDQARRPLWTFDAASRGARVVLVFYASSYQLFDYGNVVPADIRHPSLLMNIWDECWFQTDSARADILPMLPNGVDCKVVGAFDMVDSGEPPQQLPARAVAIFDVEPNASTLRLLQAGYILPTLTEKVIVEFWSKLADIAKQLDFVIVHKPKRYWHLRQEWRYRELLASLKAEGRMISLAPEFGPMRLMRHVAASVILPFTSVGDLAVGKDVRVFFFDAYRAIPNPEKYSGGIPVAAGAAEMSDQLAACFSDKSVSLKASL